jgi:GDPmannose 4,6-dehydratase
MHKILQADVPDDFVLATGEARSVREFVARCVCRSRPQHRMAGQGRRRIGIDCKSGKTIGPD